VKIKPFTLLFLYSLILALLAAFLRRYVSVAASSLTGFILFFALVVYGIKRYRTELSAYLVLLAVLAGICIVQVPLRVPHFGRHLLSLPDFMIQVLAVLLGFTALRTRKSIGITASAAGLVFVLFMFFYGYTLWSHRLDFGSFKEEVMETVPAFRLTDTGGRVITNETFRDRIVVLDFWQTSCGICFKKFPLLQAKYEQYRNTRGVEIYAINIPVRRDSAGQAENTLRKLNYTFPQMIGQLGDNPFRIRAFPTTLVLVHGNTIVYRGGIDGIDGVIGRLIGK
jgi:thiol-disulfide isomerase/thioredoxin